MKKKQFRLIVKMALVVIFMGGMLLSHFFVIGIVFAQNQKQQEKVIDIDKLDQKVNTIEKKIDAIEQKISKYEPEICAIEKLIEISEQNLIAPKYVTGVLIGLIVVFGALISIVIFIIRKTILEKIKETGDEYKKEISKLISSTNDLRKEEHNLFAYSYNTTATDEWQRGKFDKAIEFGEKAIMNWEKAFEGESQDFEDKAILYRFKSNLAYFYVDRGRTDKKGKAIEYAKLGLEAGEKSDELNLIDNYLYVIMNFSESTEDKKEWLRVFKTYKDSIYKAGIREKGKEQQEFDAYYDKLKSESL